MRTIMDRSLLHLELFYYVANHQGFSNAARELGVSKAYISQQISKFERDIGTRLFNRNTRRLNLTFTGESLFTYAENIVNEKKAAKTALSSLQKKEQGILRITSPNAFSDYFLADSLPGFLLQYPEITTELSLTGRVLDLVKENIDVAIRLTHEPPNDRVAKYLTDYQLIVCASYKYLEDHNEPKSPQSLTDHPCLVYSTIENYNRWPFWIDGKPTSVNVTPRLVSNNYRLILNALEKDLGIARLPSYVVKQGIEEKRIKPLFMDKIGKPIPVYAIYQPSRVLAPRVRVFIEFLENITTEK